ncbi:MAG: BNR-4 repeat-containing protein, partial [Lentisphaeria bacterium]|nr:BNR-4 repeat-containing protein [Lentisphaeria bacterium]
MRRLSLVMLYGCLTFTAAAQEVLGSRAARASVKYKPWWRLEEALFGYRPEFDPGIACFGPDNETYMRFGDVVQTLDGAGNWQRLPLAPAVKKIFSTWDGVFMQGYFAEEHIVFDDAGDAYAVLNATRSSIGRLFLLHSRDRCRTWRAYAVGLGYGRLERRDGHTRMSRPPPLLIHDSGLRGILQLVVPEKKPDGSLDVSNSKVISEDSFLVANHSGGGNSLVTIGNRIHVFFPGKTPIAGQERTGTPEYVVTHDLEDGTTTEPVFLGFGGSGAPDAHNLPVVSADSQGYLHVVLGAHHDPFKYTRSLKPNSITDGWTKPQRFGTPKRTPNEGSYTYVGLVCDAADTLHVVARWAGESYTFKLAYLRKPHGKPWEKNRNLVTPFKGNYHVWYHKLTIDRKNRLFLNYVCRASIKRTDEVPSFGKKWPSEDLSGRFLTQSHCLLMSGDQGDTWHLATSRDLGAERPDTTPATAPGQKLEFAEATMRPTGQLGGPFREMAGAGRFLVVGVGQRATVLDVSDPTRLRLVGDSAALGDSIYDIDIQGDIVAVAAWRGGLHLFRLEKTGSLQPLGTWKGGEARRFQWQGRHLYLTTGRGGLHVLDTSNPSELVELGALRGIDICAVALHGGLAYGALGSGGLNVMDVSDPAHPRQLSVLYKPMSGSDRKNAAYNVTVGGEILYVCPGPAPSVLRVFDLKNPRQPLETADLEKPWGWGRPVALHGDRLLMASLQGLRILKQGPTPQELVSWESRSIGSVTVIGDTAYATLGGDGIAALDISSSDSVKEIGRYSQPGTPFALAAEGQTLFVADWKHGIRIFDVANADRPVERRSLVKYPHVFAMSARRGVLAAALGAEGAVLIQTP